MYTVAQLRFLVTGASNHNYELKMKHTIFRIKFSVQFAPPPPLNSVGKGGRTTHPTSSYATVRV